MKLLANMMVKYQLLIFFRTLCNLFKVKAYIYLSIYLLVIDDNSKVREVDPEPMSKIEAELEAELARLELNITSKRLEEESSDINDV